MLLGKKRNPSLQGTSFPSPPFLPHSGAAGKKEDEIGQLDVTSRRFVVNPSLSLLFLFGTVDVPAEGDLHRGTVFLRGKSQCLA